MYNSLAKTKKAREAPRAEMKNERNIKMSVKHLNSENFKEIISKGTALVDFYADWCGPCRMLAPVIEDIANERPGLAVAKVNVDGAPELAREFGIVSIPTVIIFKGGEPAKRITGVRPKAQLLSLIDDAERS